MARASWDLWVSDGTSTYKQHSLYPENKETSSWQQQESDNRSQSWEFQADYVNQFTEESKLEAGYKGTLSSQKSPVETYSGETEATAAFDELLYNKYSYDRNIQALYATFSTKVNNFGLQLGLRGEYTDTETKSLGYRETEATAIPYKDDYFSLFPSLFLSYSLPKNHEIQVNYTPARISRPRGWQLNPFMNRPIHSISRSETLPFSGIFQFLRVELHQDLGKTHAIRLHLLPEHGRRDPTYSLPGRGCHEKHVG